MRVEICTNIGHSIALKLSNLMDDEKQNDVILLPLHKCDQIELNHDFSKLIINNTEKIYQLQSCTILITQLILDLIQCTKDFQDNLHSVFDDLLSQITSNITDNLSSIIEDVCKLRLNELHFDHKLDSLKSNDNDYEQTLSQFNTYLISLWMKYIKTNSNDSIQIYMIRNLTDDIHKWCIDLGCNYLKLSKSVITEILPLLLNVLESSCYLHGKIQQITETQINDNFRNEIREIITTAFKFVSSEIKQIQCKDIEDDIKFMDYINTSLQNHDEIFNIMYNETYPFLVNLKDDIINVLLTPFTNFAANKIEINSKYLKEETYYQFISKIRSIFSWFMKNCVNEELALKIEQFEAKCFDSFISLEVYNLSNKLDEIQEVINLDLNEISDLKESCYDEQDHCYYGTSIIGVINLLDNSIMTMISDKHKNKYPPMQQHHILQLAEFFTSSSAHYVLSISAELNNINTFEITKKKELKIFDKFFICVGSLHKFEQILQKYLENVNILKKYKDAKYRSRTSSLTKNQNEETINNKLKCETIFSLISTTLEETANKLANDICNKLLINQKLIGIIWKQPINESYSNEELKKLMQKYIWFKIVPFIKCIQNQTTIEFFNICCFEIHRKILNNIKSLIIPLTINDVLSFIQVL